MLKQKQKQASKSGIAGSSAPRRKRSHEQSSGGPGNMLRQYQLRVTSANDRYEAEADEMARRVVDMPENLANEQKSALAAQVTPLVQRQENNTEEEEKEERRVQRQETKEEEEELQAQRIQRQDVAEEEEEAQAKDIQRQELTEEEEVQAQRLQLQQTEEEEEQVQAKRLQKQEAEEEEELQVSRTQGDRGGRVSPQMEERIQLLTQGGGRPLDKESRDYFEPRFGADFSQVRIHDSAEAAQIAGQMNSRAFTQGQHIFFGQGQYQPQSTVGRDLLAHELTHTIQQGAVSATGKQQQRSVQREVIQRENGQGEGESGGSQYRYTDTEIVLGPLHLPPFKMTEHRAALYNGRQLFRERNFTRGNPGQREVWFGDQGVGTSQVETKLTSPPYNMQPDRRYMFKPRSGLPGSELRFGTPAEIAPTLKFPYWDNQGREMKGRGKFQVDHIVELQIGGWPTTEWLNTIDNMELLDPGANQSSGASINAWLQGVGRGAGEIDRFVESETGQTFRQERLPERLREAATSTVKDHILSHYRIVFEGTPVTDRNNPDNIRFWTPGQIDAGEHMDAFTRARKQQRLLTVHDISDPDRGNTNNDEIYSPYSDADRVRLFGSSERIVIYYQSFGGKNGFMDWSNRLFGQPITGFQQRDNNSLGIELESMTINAQGTGGNVLGSFTGKPFAWKGRGQRRMSESSINATILRLPGSDFAGYIAPQSMEQITASLAMMSPITINSVSFAGEEGLTARGKVLPTIPLIQRADIDIVLTASEVRIEKALDIGEINVPRPFSIPSSSLILSLGMESGLGIQGQIDFGIDRVGQGYIGASAQTGHAGGGAGFALEGGFDFDTELFDPARIELSYRNNQFGARGTIGIPSGRINGIRSAQFTIGYENNTITASGTAQFAAPGIQNAGLNLTYSEQEGLVIGGTVQLGQVPGLRGGSLDAQIQRKPDGSYKVNAMGTAQPAIPGINSQVSLSYDDGIFDANVTASYSRGMLNGEMTLGATNRPVDPESNQPTGDPQPGNVRAYGGGQVTVQIAPWLQGTVGIKLLPNAEIELRGEIGLPSTVDLFPRRAVEKNIFTLNIDIPIVGVAVAGQRIGIFATIGGGVDVSAGFGPGQIRELSLGITYNPDHEDQTHVTGRGQLYVPADAGLRLFVRGGLGAGIPIVSATAGLEVSGELGLEGALEANVNVDWMPTTGLEINANAGIFVEPKLRLSVDAYVDVSADLLLTTIDLYNERWNLAGIEYGSNLRFGINFPIHYQEGEPFDVSLDDIQFTVPDIDARSLISGVLDQF